MRRAILALVLVGGGCGSKADAPSAAQLAEIDRIFAEAASARPADQLEAAVRAVATVAPGDQPCTVAFDRGDRGRFADSLVMWMATRSPVAPSLLQAGLVSVAHDESQLAGLTSTVGAVLDDERRRLRAQEPPYRGLGGAALVERARALVAAPPPPELVVVIAAARDAEAIDDKTYAGGLVLGRAYLYSAADQRVVCAGEVMAESSASITVWVAGSGADQPMITGDLYMNLITAAEQSLRATR